MCYGMGCGYESYPYGYNEGCVCRLPRGCSCPMEQDDDACREAGCMYGLIDGQCSAPNWKICPLEAPSDEDDYFPSRKLDGEEKYWPEWAFRRA